MPTVEFVNLKRQFNEIESDLRAAIESVLTSQAFIQGPAATSFASKFQAALGAGHVVGCSNGTSALSIAFEALGIGRDDEIITVANTFIATAEAIFHVGARPVFVDVDPLTHNMDPDQVEQAIGPRTRAIVPVHLYGSPSDMDALQEIAKRHGLLLIEDAAQAHLASYRGRSAGTIGDAAGFSFYPGKNLGAFGDAGAMVFRDPSVADRARKLVDHGRSSKYEHDVIGYNHRIDGMQAAILEAKLAHLPAWTARRRAVAASYHARLGAAGFCFPQPVEGGAPVYHLLVVEVSNRHDAAEALRRDGIATGVHYPVPLHRQPAITALGLGNVALPVTERLADRIISLPICGSITDEEVEYVCDRFLAAARP